MQWQKIQLVKFTQCAVIQWLEDVMCVFTFPTQKMLSEAKIENVPFVSIKQTVETSSRKSVKSSVTMSRSNVFVLGWLASVAYPKK